MDDSFWMAWQYALASWPILFWMVDLCMPHGLGAAAMGRRTIVGLGGNVGQTVGSASEGQG